MTAQMTEALLKWLSTFKSQNSSQSDLKSWNDVSDGVAMAKVLHRIDSTHFNSGEKQLILYSILFINTSIKRLLTIFDFIWIEWVSKIRGDIPSDNKRLRANNLKKVSNAIEEYNSEVLGIHFNSDFVHPDVTRAAEGNRQEMGMSISNSLTIIDNPCLLIRLTSSKQYVSYEFWMQGG